MKKFFSIILSLLFLIRIEAAVLDITGWQQKTGATPATKPVTITGVAAGETLFFTGTAGSVTSRLPVATDISDSSSIGRTLMTTTDASSARIALGLVIGTDVPPVASPSFTGEVTIGGTMKETPNAMGALAVDLTKALNTKTASGSQVITFSGALSEGETSGLRWTNDGLTPATISWAIDIYDANTGDLVSNFVVPPSDGSGGHGMRHVVFGHNGTDMLIYQGGGSGGITQPITLTDDLDADGNDITNAGVVAAASFSGSMSGATNIPAEQLTGSIGDISTGTLATTEARVVTPTAGVGNVIVTTNGTTVIQLDAATEVLTFSSVPPEGTRFSVILLGHTSDCVVDMPTSNGGVYSQYLFGALTEITVPADEKVQMDFERHDNEYVVFGNPVFISTLPPITTTATSSLIEVEEGGVSKSMTIANFKKVLRVGTKVYGSIASGATGDVTLDWESTDTIIYNVGGNATHTLPLASSLGGPVGLMYQFSASGIITLDPNAADYIRLGATTQSDGVTIVITGTAGETFFVWGDGTNWSTTSGGTADVVPGS